MADIHEALRAEIEAWNRAYETKSDVEIRNLLSKDFRGYFSHSGADKPDEYGYDWDIVASLKMYDNAKKNFEPIDICERKNGTEFLVYGNETNEINGIVYRAKVFWIWRLEGDELKLLREYIELEQ